MVGVGDGETDGADWSGGGADGSRGIYGRLPIVMIVLG